jgi:hypothetical protein
LIVSAPCSAVAVLAVIAAHIDIALWLASPVVDHLVGAGVVAVLAVRIVVVAVISLACRVAYSIFDHVLEAAFSAPALPSAYAVIVVVPARLHIASIVTGAVSKTGLEASRGAVSAVSVVEPAGF